MRRYACTASKCFPWYEQLLHNVHWAKNVDQQLAAAEHVDDALKTEGVQIGAEWKESICSIAVEGSNLLFKQNIAV